MSKKTITIVIVIFIVVALVAVGTIYVISQSKKPKGAVGEELKKEKPPEKKASNEYSTGVNLGGVGQGTENPLKDMPVANPLENVANPYRDPYKNPFK